jgi:hypothetical protein
MITTIVCTNANMDTSAMAHTTGVEAGAEEEGGDGGEPKAVRSPCWFGGYGRRRSFGRELTAYWLTVVTSGHWKLRYPMHMVVSLYANTLVSIAQVRLLSSI